MKTGKNPVAKHAGKFCKAATHRDRTKYVRREKHVSKRHVAR